MRRKAGLQVALLVAALAVVPLFSGGSCTVVYSSCTCDPCFQVCPCNEFCDRFQTVDYEDVRRLSTYELAIVVEPDGRATRIYSGIVGISFERAIGRAEFTSEELRRFASSVIAVNPRLFGDARWELEFVDGFQTGYVVTYRANETRTLTFLFDVRGNLVEIDDGSP